MNTDNGALDFEAALTLETLSRQIEEAKRQIAGLSDSAVNDAKKMDSGFSGVEKRIAQVASVAALAGLGREIANVRGEFQKYEAILTNTFDSNDKAVESMNMLTDIAAKTPFQLDAITDSYIKLVNQGFTPTRAEIIKMGDLASSTGKGFDQLVEAILDAQNGEFERLKEFGIKASVSGDKVKMTFKGQTTEIDKSAAAMRTYILSLGGMKGVAGSMEAISGTIVGQISNLEDAFTQMFNNIGQENEGLISGIISGANYAVQHYQDIIDILLPIVATYGAYKGAVIAFAAAQKVAAAATFAQEYFVMAKRIGFAATNQLAFNNAVLANPYAIAIVALAGLSIAVYEIATSMSEAEVAQKRLTDAMAGADQKISDEKGEIKSLVTAINDENASREYRNKKLKELIAISPEHLNNLTLENIKTAEGTAAIDGYIQAMERRIKMETLDAEMKESVKRKQDAERGKENISFVDKVKAAIVSTGIGGIDAAAMSLAGSNVENNLAVIDAEKKLQAKIMAERAKLFEEINSDNAKIPETVINGKYWEAQAKEAQEAIMLLDTTSATYASDRAKQLAIISRAEAELSKIKGPKNSTASKEKQAKKTELDLLKEEIEAKKFAYGEDLASYADYLSQKSAIVTKKGDKDQIKAVKEAQKDNDREISKNLDALVSKYADYEGKKNEIMKRFEGERLTLIAAGKTKEVAELDKKEKEELNNLNATHVKESASYQYLFENIEKLSVRSLQKRIERLKQDLSATAATAEERLAIEKALAEASAALVSRAPMLALKVLNDKANDIKRKIASAKTKEEKDSLQGQLDENISKRGEALATVFGNVSSRLGEARQLAGMFSDELATAVDMASNIANGFAQIASKNYVGGAITIATSVATMLSNAGPSYAEREAKKTAKLTDAINDTNKALERQIRLTELLQGLAKSGGYADAMAQNADAMAKNTEAMRKELDAYTSKIADSKKFFANVLLKEKFTTLNYKDKAGRDALLGTLGKGMDNFTNTDWQTVINSAAGEQKKRLEELYEQWITLKEKEEEYFNAWAEGLTGTSFDSMVDGIASAFDDGIYSAEEFSKNFEDLMKTAVLNALKTNVIDEHMRQWNKHFADAMKDGVLSKEEADALRKEMQDIKDKAAAGLDAINQAGIDFGTDKETASLSGSISSSVTEETATLLSGYINAIRINQINSISVMNNMLSQLNVIAGNTSYNKHLESIDKSLAKLSGDSTRAWGI